MYLNEHYTSVPQTRPPTRPPPGRNRNTPGQLHHQHQHPKNTASTTPRITDNYPHHHQQRNPAAFFGLTLGCPCWVGGSDSGLLRPCLPGACCPRVMPAFACGQSCLHRGVLRLVPGWLWLKSSRLVPWRGRVGTAYPCGGVAVPSSLPCRAGTRACHAPSWTVVSGLTPRWGVRARRHTPTAGDAGRATGWCCGCGSRIVFGGWCSLCGDGAGFGKGPKRWLVLRLVFTPTIGWLGVFAVGALWGFLRGFLLGVAPVAARLGALVRWVRQLGWFRPLGVVAETVVAARPGAPPRPPRPADLGG